MLKEDNQVYKWSNSFGISREHSIILGVSKVLKDFSF